jgi:DNA-nicking Smr family endonuclease
LNENSSGLDLRRFSSVVELAGLPHLDEPIELPIDGVLDLHTFKPREIKDLVLDYLAACQERGILQVRIIHGKGIGNLRRTVHSILSKHPDVVSYSQASELFGGWGATIVLLKRIQTQKAD